MKQKKIKNKRLAVCTIIGFLTLTLIPNIIMLTGLEEKSKFNKTTHYPEINAKNPRNTLSSIKYYYLSNHGLKSTFINTYIEIKKNILHENPIPYRVVEGKEKWYFLGNFNNNILDNTFGFKIYSDVDLYRMKQNLIDLKLYLKSIGVDFYLVIAPNKSTIYREKLPYSFPENKTPYSQFLSKIKIEDSLNIIDLRPVLTKLKDSTQLYHKTDTHWNHFGAYIAYNEVINNINKTHDVIKPTSLNHFLAKKDCLEGDISRMININTKESITRYKTNTSSLVEISEDNDDFTSFSNQEKDLKLLMYRDSFANNLIDYFNSSFNEVVYYRYNIGIKKSDIIKTKPDVFILEVGERHFDVLLKNLKLIN